MQGYLYGCGLTKTEVTAWLAVWDRLAAGRIDEEPSGARSAPAGWITAAGIDGNGRDHFQQKALGQRNAGQGGDLFRGREAARAAIRAWLRQPIDPGLPLVVTGQPGAGKSSVVARVAREISLDAGQLGLMFFARDATHDTFLTALGRCLGRADVTGMIDVVETWAARPDARFLLVVDALDEAGSPADRDEIVSTLMAVTALPGVRAVVATRRLSAQNPFTTLGLLATLGVRSAAGHNLVDLDDDRYFDPDGLRAVAAALLRKDGATHPGPPGAAWQHYRADRDLTDRLAAIIGRRAERNYLVAALAAHPLSMDPRPMDPLAPDFDESRLPSSVREALTKYLDHLVAAERVRVRGLLLALAYARGAGLDDGMWLRFAAALDSPVSGADLEELRDSPAADYLLQSNRDSDGTPVTRLFHQALADELKAQRNRGPSDELKLFRLVRPAGPAGWAGTPYARRHAADHAAAADRLGDLLDDPAFLAHCDLFRLLPVIPAAPGPALAGTAAVLRRAAGRADSLPPPARAQLIALAALHLQQHPLQHRLLQLSDTPHVPLWAHGLGRSHQQFNLLPEVTALAVGGFGRTDVIVATSGSAELLILDANGQLLTKLVAPCRRGIAAVTIGVLAGAPVIVALGHDGTLCLWNEDLRADDLRFPPQPVPATAVAVGRFGQGDVIATATDRTMQLWTAEGAPLGPRFPMAHISVKGLTFGQWEGQPVLASTGLDGAVRFWREHGGRAWGRTFIGHQRAACAVAVGRLDDREVVAVAHDDRAVRLWHGPNQLAMDPLTEHTDMVNAVAIGTLGDRQVIATGSRDGAIRIWDSPATGSSRTSTSDHRRPITALATGIYAGRPILVTTSDDSSVRVWDLDGRPVGAPLTTTASPLTVTTGPLNGINVIAVVGRAGSVQIWDDRRRLQRMPLTSRPVGATAVQIGRAGGRYCFVTTHHDGLARRWDSRGNLVSASFGRPGRTITGLAIGRLGDAEAAALGYSDGLVRIFDLAAGTALGQNGAAGSAVTAMTIAHGILAVGYDDGTVRHFDAASGSGFHTAREAHRGKVSAVTIGSAGDQLVIASAGADRRARIWTRDGAPAESLELLEAPHGMVITADGQLVIAAGPALCGWQLCF
ncbi:hypothetical protein [Actinoplanes nipponensis]|uniref:hypothetical protein n=1 Tax=Actinoplanes nipponensis TaxID=135950 RepID=UPI00194208C8|nr:hypothetical protein [Actinoplanes nipponensis]